MFELLILYSFLLFLNALAHAIPYRLLPLCLLCCVAIFSVLA